MANEKNLALVPQRSYTGGKIKAKVVKAMSEQAEAEQEASRALDKLFKLLKSFEEGIPGRYAFSSDPDL